MGWAAEREGQHGILSVLCEQALKSGRCVLSCGPQSSVPTAVLGIVGDGYCTIPWGPKTSSSKRERGTG